MYPSIVPTLALLLLAAVGPRAFADGDNCPAETISELTTEARLHKDILCGYNTDFRPVRSHENTVNVTVSFTVKYISFNFLEETFTVHSWVMLSWLDEYLKWNPSKYGGISSTSLESHKIWTPQMALFNADISKYQTDQFYTTCQVLSNGSVTCLPYIAHSGLCHTTLQRWPYDEQDCTLYFGSWMHTGEQINFTFDAIPITTDDYQDGPGWRLKNVSHKRYPGKYSCCPNETYPMLKYTFKMQREAAGPAAIVVVPSIAIVILTLVSLMIDIKDCTRLILICFSLLLHFVFLTEIGYNIPKESSETPIILLFIRDSMIITFFTILQTLLLMSLRKKVASAPAWILSVNRLAQTGPGKYVVFSEFDPDKTVDEKATLTDELPGSSTTEEPKRGSDWIQFANLLNSIMLIITVLTYTVLIAVYIPRDD